MERERSTSLERDRMSDRDRNEEITRDMERRGERMREMDDSRRYEEDRGRELTRRGYGGSILGRDPWLSPGFEMMRQMMSRSFGDFFGAGRSMSAMPRVEVFEKKDRIFVRAELPGMSREDVKVRVVDDALVLEGERRSERDRDRDRHEGMYESEFQYGRFSRQIVLPGRIDPNQVRARFQNGVLEVELTCETPKAREVPIEGERDVISGRGR